MKALFVLIFFAIMRSSICGGGHFYLTFWNGSELTVMEGGSPINTVGLNWTTRSYFNNSFYSTGWDILEVVTNPALSDEDQAYQAGWIEGYLTQQQIDYHWYNVERPAPQIIPASCNNAMKYLKENMKWIQFMVDTRPNDPYWHQVKLFYRQIDGLYDGYTNATNNVSFNISYEDMLVMNFHTDFQSLLPVMAAKNESKFFSNSGHCSALIKILPGYSDVLFSHATWMPYIMMNRIIKRYKFAFHLHANSVDLIPGQSVAFSSYGGMITSLDDFYIINSGLFVTETSFNIFNNKTYKFIKPVGQVLDTVRVVVANRLSTSTQAWSRYFSLMNSGTYNNQWMIVDLKMFRPGFEPKQGFLRVLEQMPGLIESHDQTEHIIANSYWASYNIPFYKSIYNSLGYKKDLEEFGSFNSYTDTARAKMFQRDHSSVTDLDSMLRVIQYNHYKTDPYSVFPNSTPDHNACLAISARCDLNPVNGSFPWFIPFSLCGAIDAKIGSYSMFQKGEMVAISGPTQSDGLLPPFKWSSAPKNIKDHYNHSHLGQPDLWDFGPILTSWIQPFTQANS